MKKGSYSECHFQNLIDSNSQVVLLTPQGLNMNHLRF